MPAPFISSLCGYRDGNPNTSDASSGLSVVLGKLLFEAMGIKCDVPALADNTVGGAMATMMSADLSEYFLTSAPHLTVRPEQALDTYEQYSHLGAATELRKSMATEVALTVKDLRRFAAKSPIETDARTQLITHLDKIDVEVMQAETKRLELLDLLGEESVLKLDIAISRATPGSAPLPSQHLITGLSLKWSLRTDRAQDCRTQGAKMASLRRGRMPHFATVTMEPRPSMLNLLGRGAGDVDCVYHLHLPALSQAIDEYCSGTRRKDRLKMRDNFLRLCDQRRLRDYDELRSYVSTL